MTWLWKDKIPSGYFIQEGIYTIGTFLIKVEQFFNQYTSRDWYKAVLSIFPSMCR